MIIPAFSDDFACCGHYKQCEMGKLKCYYADPAPHIKNGCMAWRRNNKQQPAKSNTTLNNIKRSVTIDDIEIITGDQLSLFD